jgi:predicted O-methyltransferase YrrM
MLRKIRALRRALTSVARSGQSLLEIRQGIENQGNIFNERLGELRAGLENQSNLINDRFSEIREGIENQSNLMLSCRTGGIPASPSDGDQTFDDIIVLPIQPISYPLVELGSVENAIGEIIESEDFARCTAFFSENPASKRSLVSPQTQALMYTLIRNMEPEHVFEIGTYRGGSTEAICRALLDNGHGVVHTIDPFGLNTVPKIMACWPPPLRQHAIFYPVDSMAFYGKIAGQDIHPDLIFVDGNHDLEFASFDIECAARLLKPGGLILVDNVSQPGPFIATRRFLARNPSWQRILGEMKVAKPYDRERTSIQNTDLAILRAPRDILISEEPWTFGQRPWSGKDLRAIVLDIGDNASGNLHVQCVLRTFGDPLEEHVIEGTFELRDAVGVTEFPFDHPMAFTNRSQSDTIELWITWVAPRPLILGGLPRLIDRTA